MFSEEIVNYSVIPTKARLMFQHFCVASVECSGIRLSVSEPLHTLAGYFCAPGETRTHCTKKGLTVGLRNLSEYLMAVRVPLSSLCLEVCAFFHEYASPDSITLATSSPGYFMPVKSDQVKMLPSVKCTGHHWSTYQFW